jgi:ubiquitin-protein ligase
MATIIQKKRFAGEVKILNKEPLHYATAYPDEEDPLTWYFLIEGQKDTEYESGRYLGKIVHSPSYPVSPPDYYMFTPSGRYEINKKICLTNSSYHKGDWSSTWNIKTILIAYYSIWLDDSEHGISHIKRTKEERLTMAKESHEFNEKNYKKILDGFNLENIKVL